MGWLCGEGLVLKKLMLKKNEQHGNSAAFWLCAADAATKVKKQKISPSYREAAYMIEWF